MVLIFTIVALSLVGSFFCSISEASLYSVSHARIETLRRHGLPGGKILSRLRSSIEEPIAAILILNTVFNTMGAVWAGALVDELFGLRWMMTFSAAFTVAMLLFSEIVPKSLGVVFSDRLAPRLARPLQALIWTLWPLVRLCTAIARLFGRKASLAHITEEDVISTAELSRKSGHILP